MARATSTQSVGSTMTVIYATEMFCKYSTVTDRQVSTKAGVIVYRLQLKVTIDILSHTNSHLQLICLKSDINSRLSAIYPVSLRSYHIAAMS